MNSQEANSRRAPWPFAFYKQNKNLEKEKKFTGESIVLKCHKSKRSKLNATESCIKIAPVDINETFRMMGLNYLSRVYKSMWIQDWLLEESRSYGSQNGLCT